MSPAKGGTIMYRRGMVFAVSMLTALLLALPMAARTPKNSKTIVTDMDLLNPTSLGGKPLKPGSYKIRVDESKVTVEQGGKMVAEAAVQWKDGTSKAQYSSFVTDDHGVTEIHFSGKTQYVEIAE
jgi:hypothetical protein